MKATIGHESRGRMRLRLRQKTMTLRQADLLEAWLKSQPWTKEAVVHERTCCVIVTYAGERETVLSAVGGFTWAGAEETVTAVQENAADILAAAKDINEARAAKEAEAQVEGPED